MRLLIADKLHPRAIEELRTLSHEVVYEPELTKDSLEAQITNVGILVVRSTEVTSRAIERAKALHLIVRAGAETTTIDVRSASKRGIFVTNCPGKNSSAVAELVFGLLISIDRRIPDAVVSLRSSRWERGEYAKAEGLVGKTLGIAGMGAIGRDVAQRAKAFGLNVIGWSRSLSPAKAADLGIGHVGSLAELAAKSNILSVHLPLNDRTKGIIDERILGVMPPRSIFINAARAGLVDENAMRTAIQERGLRVGLDVFSDEPKGRAEYKSDLFAPASATGGFVYATPHIAASTDRAQLAISTETVRIIRCFLTEGVVPNVVNVTTSVAKFQIVIRMLDKVGTFANVLSVLKRHGINIEEVNNTIFEGGGASCAKLRVLTRPSEVCLQEIRAFEEVLQVDVVTLPNLA